MRDIYTISPHVLVGDGSVLTLPTDDDDRLGIAVFQSKGLAEELAPDGFRPAYCGPEELEKLAEADLAIKCATHSGSNVGRKIWGRVCPRPIPLGFHAFHKPDFPPSQIRLCVAGFMTRFGA